MSCPPKSELARSGIQERRRMLHQGGGGGGVVKPKLLLFNSSFRGDIVGAVDQIDTAVEDVNIEVSNAKVLETYEVAFNAY